RPFDVDEDEGVPGLERPRRRRRPDESPEVEDRHDGALEVHHAAQDRRRRRHRRERHPGEDLAHPAGLERGALVPGGEDDDVLHLRAQTATGITRRRMSFTLCRRYSILVTSKEPIRALCTISLTVCLPFTSSRTASSSRVRRPRPICATASSLRRN